MISRRRLIATGGLLAGGLAVGLSVPTLMRVRTRLQRVPALGDPGWIVIAPDESVTLYSTLVEMGQGVWTALAQIVGEELEADFTRLRVQMAPSWRAYGQPVGFDTSGSTSVQRLFTTMRSVGAAARHMLVETAASDWSVPASECRAMGGVVFHEPSGRNATYGSLAARASGREPPASPQLKTRGEWRFIGKSPRRVDGAGKVDGSARYAMDLHTAGMLVAAVSQAAFDGGKLMGIDRAAAMASPGVVRIVELGDTVAVVARNYWSAARGLARAGVKWSVPADGVDTATLAAKLRTMAAEGLPLQVPNVNSASLADGSSMQAADAKSAQPANGPLAQRAQAPSVQSANAQSAHLIATPSAGPVRPGPRTVRGSYEAPLLAHAQMEPQSAIAQVNRLTAEIWAPAQTLDRMQQDVAKALGLWSHAVTVHATPLGGGFGRRLTSEPAVTAALIAKEVGAPVQAVWSRSDDFLQDRFRPMSAVQLEANLDEQGHIAAFKAHIASLGESSRKGALAVFPYAAKTVEVNGTNVRTPLRLGSWRSVDYSQAVFFRECFIDECAAAAGIDPLAYRRTLLAGKERALRVLDAVAEMSGWEERAANIAGASVDAHEGVSASAGASKGSATTSSPRHLGLAFHDAFESPCAQVVELERTPDGAFRITRVFIALDCGTAINPNGIRAQLEGGLLMALSAALYEEVTFEKGELRQRNFDTYRIMRMNAAPAIEVRILETPDASIGGIGEAGVPPAAPALINALHAATGQRVRSLPLARSGFTWA